MERTNETKLNVKKTLHEMHVVVVMNKNGKLSMV